MADFRLSDLDVRDMKLGTKQVSAVYFREGQVWPSKQYFTTVAKSSGTIKFSGTTTGNTLQYSVNNGAWSTSSNDITVNVSSGDKVRWKGNLRATASGTMGSGRFSGGTADMDLEGNVMSLLYNDDFGDQKDLINDYTFYVLFSGNTHVLNAEKLELPATGLTTGCYSGMFQACTKMTKGPKELPATNAVQESYNRMFYNCSALTTCPDMSATTIGLSGCTYTFYRNKFTTNPFKNNITFVGSCGLIGTFYSCPTLSDMSGISISASTASACTYMFYGCSALTAAPSLVSTSVGESGYRSMFYDCRRLTTAPSLPATNISISGYSNMFYGCLKLTTPPSVLSATTVNDYAYDNMFRGCTGLTTMPTISATTVGQYGCRSMFYGCTSLTTAKDLSITVFTGGSGCIYMFYGCTSLTKAPALPATNISGYSYPYGYMFQGCTSLKDSPVLPAKKLGFRTYYYMFQDCTSLSGVTCYAEDISGEACTTSWLGRVAPTGILYRGDNGTCDWEEDSVNGIPSGWTLSPPCASYLTTKARTSGTIKFSGKTSNHKLQYSLDNGDNWSSLSSAWTVNVSPGTAVMWKGVNTPVYESYGRGIGWFSGSTSEFDIEGNIMSVLYGDNYQEQTSIPENGVATLFFASKVVDASGLLLPATTLGDYCYQSMFERCTYLTAAPKSLPATTVGKSSYSYMFYQCSGLTSVQTDMIKAETLGASACSRMFGECFSLTNAPDMNATTLSSGSCSGMFATCSSMTTAMSELPAANVPSSAYTYMFSGCTSLRNAPNLLATTLGAYCCRSMFQGCTSLTTAPGVSATTLATYCCHNMFRGCTSLTTAMSKLPAETLASYCYNYMFAGCTGLTRTPELPALTLASNCYGYMFSGCTSLNYVKMMATDISASNCMNGWLYNVAPTGTFVKNPDATWVKTGSSGIPEGWTVEYASS